MWIIGRVLRWLIRATAAVGVAALALMMIQITLDVVLKNILGITVPSTSLVVSYYYMILIGFLPLALAERLDAHIAVDAVFQLLRPRAQRVVVVAVWFFSCAVMMFVTWQTWLKALDQYRLGTFVVERDVPVPIWPGYFALPIGFGVFSLVLGYRALCGTFNLKNGLDVDATTVSGPIVQGASASQSTVGGVHGR